MENETKVYAKTRSDSGQWYLEIHVNGDKNRRRAYTLAGIRNALLLETDDAKLTKQKQSHNVESGARAKILCARVFKIVSEIGADNFLALADQKMGVDEIEREVASGKSVKMILSNRELSGFTLIEFTTRFLMMRRAQQAVLTTGWELKLEGGKTAGIGYLRAVNRFLEGVGHERLAGRRDFEGFLAASAAIDWQVKEVSTDVVCEYIATQGENLLLKQRLDGDSLKAFLDKKGITIKKATENNPGQKFGFARYGALAERITDTWLRYLAKDLMVREIHVTHLAAFGRRLAKMRASMYANSFRSILKYAATKNLVEEELLNYRYDFRPVPSVRKDDLDQEEITRLAATPWVGFEKWRLGFLLSTQTGLRKVDLGRLKFSHVAGGWMRLADQKKTGVPVEVPLTDLAKSIIEKVSKDYYKGKPKPDDFVFQPWGCSESWMGIALPAWLAAAGITDKNILFHSARVSFCSVAINAGVDHFLTAQMLGHQGIKLVATYLRRNPQKMEAEIKKVNPGGEEATPLV